MSGFNAIEDCLCRQPNYYDPLQKETSESRGSVFDLLDKNTVERCFLSCVPRISNVFFQIMKKNNYFENI